MREIEVFADVRCPFAHVGLRRLAARRDELGREVVLRVHAWPLELVNDAPLDPALIAEEAEALHDQVAGDLFRGFSAAALAPTSIPAMALTAAAYDVSPMVGERVALALRWAQFEEGADIATPAVLLDVASAAGISLPDHGGRDEVMAEWDDGRSRGVIGSPHWFVAGDDFFCPTLKITRHDGHLHIENNEEAFAAFVEHALR